MPSPRLQPPDEGGFTLIEVMVATIVLGFIASGVATAVILFFRTADGTSGRLALSHDSQLLATYLIPDLDSATSNSSQPVVATPNGASDCPAGFPSFSRLELTFSDSVSNYRIDYDVTTSGTAIDRTFVRDGAAQPPLRVVHNLKPQGACFGSTPGPPWTVKVILTAKGDPAGDYKFFSVTGGGRVTTAPVPDSTVPGDVVALATNGVGQMDSIVVHFNQTLNLNDNAVTTEWKLSDSTLSIPSEVIAGSTATLTVAGAHTFNTATNGLTLSLIPQPGGIRNAVNRPVTGFTLPVGDGMAPVPTTVVSRATHGDGRMTQVVITFSEDLASYSAGYMPWRITSTIHGPLDPITFDTNTPPVVSMSNRSVTLAVAMAPVDTAATGIQLGLSASRTGIRDGAGNLANFGPTPVSDGMAPIVTNFTSRGNTPGLLDRTDTLTLTFSEPVAPAPTNPTLTMTGGNGTANDSLSIPGIATIDLGAVNLYIDPTTATWQTVVSTNGNVVIILVNFMMTGQTDIRTATTPTVMKVTPSGALTDQVTPRPNSAGGVYITPAPVLLP